LAVVCSRWPRVAFKRRLGGTSRWCSRIRRKIRFFLT
jgi:hypothetical protein